MRAFAYAAKEARVEAGVKQVRVAAELDVDQSTIARFEKGGGWPADLGRTLAAYEAVTGVPAQRIGIEGFQLWGAETLAQEIEDFLSEHDEGSSNSSGEESV